MRKVLIVENSTLFAGAERSLSELLSNGEFNNHVDILYDYQMSHQRFFGLENKRVFYRWKHGGFIKSLNRKSRFKFIRGIIIILKSVKLFLLLCIRPYEIVHFNMYRSNQWLDILICKIFKVKVIVHIRSLYPIVKITRRVNLLVDHYITVSKSVAHSLSLNKGFSVIYDSINIDLTREKSSFESDNFVILSIGQLEERKAHDAAILALKRIFDRNSDIRMTLYVLGDDPLENRPILTYLFGLADDLGLSNNVHFVPFTDDVGYYYSRANVVLSITREGEAFGRIPIEAAMYEKPVIVTDIGAFRGTVVNHKTGIFIEPDNIEDLAQGIEYYYNNPDAQYRHGRSGRLHTEKFFSNDVIVKKIKRVYDDL